MGSNPYPTFTIEAAFFKIPKALIKGGGRRSVGPPISKFCKDLGRTTGSDKIRPYYEELELHTVGFVLPNNDLRELAVPQMYPSPYEAFVQSATADSQA